MTSGAFERSQPLAVRLVTAAERTRFDGLLDEHHFLGHRLYGRAVRYVATDAEGQWLALAGFGSAGLSVGARDSYVGWSDELKHRRLRYVMANQRFCVLPAGRRPNVASAVLARCLRRLSGDVEQLYGHRVFLVETFSDPARHAGACYAAANFVAVGHTSGFARRNGTWVYHGRPKLCWVYPLRADATAILAAGFDHRLLGSTADDKKGPMLDLNQVVLGGADGLYAKLAVIVDHRKPRGVRHDLAAILLVCATAMLAGVSHVSGIAEWAADLPSELLLRLGLRASPSTGKVVAPSLSTLQRTLRAVDREALDRIVCETLAEQVRRHRTPNTTALTENTDPNNTADGGKADIDSTGAGTGITGATSYEAPRSDDDDDDGSDGRMPELLGVSVDGKTLRGARQADGRAIHLLGALTHAERVVIAQQEVDHKTNEITVFRPLLAKVDLTGCLVTADAMHAQRDHAEFLVEDKHTDFLLFVKENQPSLYNEVVCTAPERFSKPVSDTCKGHGRIETRTIAVAECPDGLAEFPHVAAVVRIDRHVADAKSGQARSSERVWAVTSVTKRRATPARLLAAARDHWSIENGLHWVRDATMREDASKVRSASAPRALATMRNLAISVLRLAGATNIAQALRTLSRHPEAAFGMLGL